MIRLRNLAMNDLQSGLTPFNTVKQTRGSIIVWIILKLWFWSFQWFFILQKPSKCLFATFSRHGLTHNIPVFQNFTQPLVGFDGPRYRYLFRKIRILKGIKKRWILAKNIEFIWDKYWILGIFVKKKCIFITAVIRYKIEKAFILTQTAPTSGEI